MLTIKNNKYFLTGPAGKLQIPNHDEITLKLAMLYEGECTGSGPTGRRPQIRLFQAALLSTAPPAGRTGRHRPSKAKPADPNPITAAPTKSSVRSSATASWIRTPRSR